MSAGFRIRHVSRRSELDLVPVLAHGAHDFSMLRADSLLLSDLKRRYTRGRGVMSFCGWGRLVKPLSIQWVFMCRQGCGAAQL